MVEKMEIQAGFKKTEVGVIPSDWEVKKIEDVASVVGGGTPSTFNSNYWNGDINWYTPTEIGLNKFTHESKRKITKEGLDNCSAKILPIGTILLTSRANIGDASILKSEGCTNQGFQSLIAKAIIDNDFLYYLVLTIKSILLQNASGSTFLEISPSKVKTILIPLPPTKAEQIAIANALNDADALISQLEKLIAKKRNIKQGAMQELLKPKEGREVKTFEEIADKKIKWSITGGPFGSNLKSSDYTKDGIRIIQLQNIGDGKFINEYEIFTSQKKADELLSCNIYPNEIILSKMGDPVARACIIPDFHKRYLMCSDGIRLVVDNKLYDSYFIYVYINFSKFRIQAENASTGTTRKRIGLKELKTLKIICPNKSEQIQIAQILSDMDAEIKVLEKKLEKYKMIKQGMMQNLLTGKIRLV